MPEPVIETLYKAQEELAGHILLATERTSRDLIYRWAKELAKVDSEIDLRLKAGDQLPLVWRVNRPAGGK